MGLGKAGKATFKSDDVDKASTSTLDPERRYDLCCGNACMPDKRMRDVVLGTLVVVFVTALVAGIFVACYFFLPGSPGTSSAEEQVGSAVKDLELDFSDLDLAVSSNQGLRPSYKEDISFRKENIELLKEYPLGRNSQEGYEVYLEEEKEEKKEIDTPSADWKDQNPVPSTVFEGSPDLQDFSRIPSTNAGPLNKGGEKAFPPADSISREDVFPTGLEHTGVGRLPPTGHPETGPASLPDRDQNPIGLEGLPKDEFPDFFNMFAPKDVDETEAPSRPPNEVSQETEVGTAPAPGWSLPGTSLPENPLGSPMNPADFEKVGTDFQEGEEEEFGGKSVEPRGEAAKEPRGEAADRAALATFKGGECQPVSLSACASSVPWTLKTVPNLLGDVTQDQLNASTFALMALVDTRCSPRILEYTCAFLEPSCGVEESPIPPCRRICRAIRNSCTEFLDNDMSYRKIFDCDSLPDVRDPTVCNSLVVAAKPEKKVTPGLRVTETSLPPLSFFAENMPFSLPPEKAGTQRAAPSESPIKNRHQLEVPLTKRPSQRGENTHRLEEPVPEDLPQAREDAEGETLLICTHDKFLCEDGSDCLPMENQCDSVQHCLDNSDEANCTTLTEIAPESVFPSLADIIMETSELLSLTGVEKAQKNRKTIFLNDNVRQRPRLSLASILSGRPHLTPKLKDTKDDNRSLSDQNGTEDSNVATEAITEAVTEIEEPEAATVPPLKESKCPQLQCLDGTCITMAQLNDGHPDCPDSTDEEKLLTPINSTR